MDGHVRPALDISSEPSIAQAAAGIAARGELRLVFDATSFLHGDFTPEKSWREIDLDHMQGSFAVNTIGPALLMKHFLPLLAVDGRSVFATLSAKVGSSIGDNQLGGWYACRAAKAALNQIARTAAIELKRRRPHAICVALHPGTVATGRTAPFAKDGLEVQTPEAAAALANDDRRASAQPFRRLLRSLRPTVTVVTVALR